MTKNELSKRKEMLGDYYVSDEELLDKYGVDPFWVEHTAFIKIGDKLVSLGEKKPTIQSTIYYNDELDSPGTGFESFKNYNIFMSGNNLFSEPDFERGYFIARNKGSNDYFILSRYTLLDEDRFEEYWLEPEVRKYVDIAIEMIKSDFIKRLERYYKRYKNNISTCGYWANR